MAIKLWENGTPGFNAVAEAEEPNLTPYIVNTDKPVGCVIVCPGGGYGHLAFHEGEPVAQMLNEGGIHAFVLRYRLSPAHHHPAMQQDVNRAVRWVRYHAAEYNIDPEKIATLGFSAGGHLTGVSVTHFDYGLNEGDEGYIDEIDKVSCRPDAGVLCYPVVSFSEKFSHGGSCKNFLGDLASDPAMVDAYSCEKAVRDDTPPCFFWHTATDKGVPVLNTLAMAQALDAKNIPFEVHIFPFGGHGMGLATEERFGPNYHVAQWAGLCVNWLHLLGF